MKINKESWKKTEKDFVGIECSPFHKSGDLQRHANECVVKIAQSLHKPLLLTLDSHFIRPDQKFIQDILLKGSDKDGWHFHGTYAQYTMEEAWLMWQERHPSLANMAAKFAEGVESNSELVSRIERIELKKEFHLPEVDFPIEIRSMDKTIDEKLMEYTIQLVSKYGRFPSTDDPQRPEYVARLREELGVIANNGVLNFLPYFITLSEEVCRPAREREILMSPGRGSSCGSLLTYLLKITHLDPIKWGLSFARFLSLARINRGKFPDIDLDFGDPSVITGALKDKFGDLFARICTTNTLKPKSAIRDVSRVVLDTKENEEAARLVDAVCASLSLVPQGVSDLQKWIYGWQDEEGGHPGEIDINAALSGFFTTYPEIERGVVDILGVPRSLGRHASAYCLSDAPISESLPMCIINDEVCTQYTMGPVEAMGFLKIDFLGLNTLKDIASCLRQIKNRHGIDIDIYTLPDEDPLTFGAFCRGQNETVFQFSSKIGVDICKRIQPRKIADLSDITAAGRPGTMYALMEDGKTTLIDAWIKRRTGKERAQYTHPDMEGALSGTLGIAIYQESLQRLFEDCCGFNPERADEVREIIGKKKKDQMDALIPEIRSILLNRGWEGSQVESFISLCISASSYAFNKSHATAYSYLGYVCQYLKCHYPLEWWTSVMQNSSSDDVKANAKYCKDFIIHPDINRSDMDFYIIDEERERIVYPLGMVRGVKNSAADIFAKRPFTSLEDFYERVNRRLVHKGVFLSLIWAGAFDRVCNITSVNERNDLVRKYFDIRGMAKEKAEFVDLDPFNILLKQNFALPLNSADFSSAISEATGVRVHGIDEALLLPLKAKVKVAGSINSIHIIKTKKGDPKNMAFIQIADRSSVVDVTVFPDLYASIADRLAKNEVVLISASISSYKEQKGLVADAIKFFGIIDEETESEFEAFGNVS